MADYLLLHEAAHGPWCWGRVWGHLTSPVLHPPRLYDTGGVGKVVAPDLAAMTGNPSGNPRPSLDDYAEAVVRQVQKEELRDLVIVGHGLTAPLVLRAGARLGTPPKRIVLLAGVIPDDGKSALDTLPRRTRLGFRMLASMNGLARRRDFRLPKAVIANVHCKGMDPTDLIQISGRFSGVSVDMLRAKVYLGETGSCPITYVPLWRDALVPPALQRRMAQRIPGVEMAEELDSGHEVMIEKPKQVADILRRFA